MSPSGTGLHVTTVSLGRAHHICAVWRVRRPMGPPDVSCAFPSALLLPRRGAEQEWAVECALTALCTSGPASGPACVDLDTGTDGIKVSSVRAGLCTPELRELARTSTGEGQEGWAALAAEQPGAFRARAGSDYRMARHAAVVSVASPPLDAFQGGEPTGLAGSVPSHHRTVPVPGCPPDGRRHRLHLVHERQETVLRDYARLLLHTETTRTPMVRRSHS
ncbi:hypothetical protein [Streptomyces meridianus]|uniref:Uncharacterized protein n=1 Tax=Streptomyces meridianus TaxID=2938945 RepID=A0ABT0X7L1_9ACTN|nr:hypothetical protein [Streptomyces meridianus]MCM2578517.1 hypothetical protein [Streptomyces meridianus]